MQLTAAEVIAHRDIDVLAICSPSGLHVEHALAAINAGKHVEVEKPLALDAAGARTIVQAAQSHGRRVFSVAQRRFESDYSHLRDVITRGQAGDLRIAEIRMHWFRDDAYYRAAPWRGTDPAGSVLLNQALHSLDLLTWLAGPARTVSAHTTTFHQSIETGDTTTATIELQSGALATISLTTAAPPGAPAVLAAHFSTGSVELGQGTVLNWTVDAPRPTEVSRAGKGGASSAAIGTVGHQLMWADIAQALRTGQPSRCDASGAISTLEMIDAIRVSAATGQRVDVTPLGSDGEPK